ncbi:MAG: cyclase family protein [Candidatus Bathyarchaeota archaeon]|nr:cyclase family protein [Candidatus Bathyarchaeota archaeon]
MIKLEKYRIIDLSAEIQPGVLKVNGEYVHGEGARRFEIRQFIYAPDKALMHWVDTETHIGTHVELPAHLVEGAKSSSEMPIEAFLGGAIVLKFSFLKPKDGEGQPITPAHLGKVKEDDIVLMWSPYGGDERPYISPEAVKWLAERPVKMVGVQNVGVEAPHGSMATHKNLLGNEIPLVEGLVNLEKICKERVFYIGLPLRVASLDASWIRAIALEPRS